MSFQKKIVQLQKYSAALTFKKLPSVMVLWVQGSKSQLTCKNSVLAANWGQFLNWSHTKLHLRGNQARSTGPRRTGASGVDAFSCNWRPVGSPFYLPSLTLLSPSIDASCDIAASRCPRAKRACSDLMRGFPQLPFYQW